jgi:hypothetical protein
MMLARPDAAALISRRPVWICDARHRTAQRQHDIQHGGRNTYPGNMRTNHILIDYENVQPESLAGLDAEHFQVLLFIGASQTKVNFEIAEAMQELGSRARYVKISGNGSNALDFHIAFYIGQLAANDATSWFHIISKDAGFDPLIQHLRAKKISVSRSKSIPDIPLLKAANSKTLPERITLVVGNLKQRGASRPRTVKTLKSTISSLFQKQLPDQELDDLIGEMQRRAYVSLHDNKVSYSLPGCDA